MERLRGAVAHNLETIPRSEDVALPENITFANMLLNQRTLNGLESAGFIRPSPVQRSALPRGLCGSDLIVQAKSGTGKTLVFGIIALERIDLAITQPQVLILVPTREIAVQIKEVLTSISSDFENLKIASFIGGLSVTDDVATARTCQIAVGTPGRVKQLVKDGFLATQAVRLFILDEADRMVDKTFLNDVCYLFSKLPQRKQSVVCSATYPPKMEKLLSKFLVNPERINPSTDTLLLGLRQFVAVVATHTNILAKIRYKTTKLLEILSSLAFRQCLIFCNVQSRMESICKDLAGRGWPALHLAGSMPQKERLAAISALQNHRCRVLLTTDLAARGVDAEQVDLVVNLDLPYDTETYLHRIGRAGRFGAPGTAISIVDENELKKLREIFFDVGGTDFQVPVLPKEGLCADTWNVSDKLEKIEALIREPTEQLPGNEVSDEPADIFRSRFLQLPTEFKPVPFTELVKAFDEFKDVELEFGLKNLSLTYQEKRKENVSRDFPVGESFKEYLKEPSLEDSSLDNFSKEESSVSSENEEVSSNSRSNIFWRQQQIYMSEMLEFASSRR